MNAVAAVADLYAQWRKARSDLDASDGNRPGRAVVEQVAWDAFRDACDALNGEDCNHPECPHPDSAAA